MCEYTCTCTLHVHTVCYMHVHAQCNNFYVLTDRPLRDDEVLPVRQHRIVPSASPAAEEVEQEVSNKLVAVWCVNNYCNPT